MKLNYPRIHALSTLGIIYHFNIDYKFHSFRTDFSGEGGSGKTMITDMVQLILVGPTAYHSATEGTGDREAEGMVYQAKNMPFSAGYLIMNVEVSPGKYLVMGAYIEKSSKQVKMFIAQAGYDWEGTFEYMDKPLYHKQFLINNQIVPVEMLDNELADINIRTFPVKQYHSLLYQNEILALDLSESRKKLDSYANIFRAFSRGKSFKTDPTSLKNFLFGDDDRHLLAKYNSEVKSINDGYQEQERYKNEIDLIDKKQGFVKDLVALEKIAKASKEAYFSQKVLFWKQSFVKQQIDFDNCLERYSCLKIEQQCLNIKHTELELSEIKEQAHIYRESQNAMAIIAAKQREAEETKAEKLLLSQELAVKVKQIEHIDRLLLENGGELDNLKIRFVEETRYESELRLLNDFSTHLIGNKVQAAFESSGWFNGYAREKANYGDELQQEKNRLLELKALQGFANLEDPDSLARWAMDHFDRPLDLLEESVLLHFKSLKRQEPSDSKNGSRYLPTPEVLFAGKLNTHAASNGKGFWLELEGIYEFIDYVDQQYLNIGPDKKKEVIAKLEQLSKGVAAELKELKDHILAKENLKEVLDSFSNLEAAVKLYVDRSDYTRAVNDDYIISEERLDELLNTYKSSAQTKAEHAQAIFDYELAVKNIVNLDPDNYAQQFTTSEKYFKDANIDIGSLDKCLSDMELDLRKLKDELDDLKLENELGDLELEGIREKLLAEVKSLNSLAKLRLQHVSQFNNCESAYKASQVKLAEFEKNLIMASSEYKMHFRKDFDSDEVDVLVNPDEGGENGLKAKYNRDINKFEGKYNVIAEEIEGGMQLIDSFHVGQLAHKLLPTVFTTPAALEEQQVDFLLSEKLKSLYQAIREIGTHKLEILKRVFSEVQKAFRDHVLKVGLIDAYFRKPNKVITGGNKASLTLLYPGDYPAKWMSVFTRILEEHTPGSLFQKLSNEIDIDKMMKDAFISEGGSKNADVEDLLNPKSYFDLEFKLTLESGEKNAGSNSQTYSGNALLGLARLSLIEDPKRKGIRIMPIDEAQGLGSNYEMLRNIALAEGYQILSMSIDTAGEIREGEQFIYLLSENKLQDEDNYVPAMGIFSEGVITPNLDDFVYGD